VLVQAAADIGLDADDVRKRLATDEDVVLISGQAQEAAGEGHFGVPTFVLAQKYAISGAQPADQLARAIRQVSGESTRRRRSEAGLQHAEFALYPRDNAAWRAFHEDQDVVHEAEEGGFWAEVPAIPGCATQGDSMDNSCKIFMKRLKGACP